MYKLQYYVMIPAFCKIYKLRWILLLTVVAVSYSTYSSAQIKMKYMRVEKCIKWGFKNIYTRKFLSIPTVGFGGWFGFLLLIRFCSESNEISMCHSYKTKLGMVQNTRIIYKWFSVQQGYVRSLENEIKPCPSRTSAKNISKLIIM